MKKIMSIFVSFSILPYLLLAGTGVSAGTVEKLGQLTVKQQSTVKKIFTERGYPGKGAITVSLKYPQKTLGFSSKLLDSNSVMTVADQREAVIQMFVANGLPEEDARKAIAMSSNEDVAAVLANPELVKELAANPELIQENGIIFCILIIVLIFFIIAACSKKGAHYKLDRGFSPASGPVYAQAFATVPVMA